MDKQLTSKLWEAADELRANSDLKPTEYSTPVLGIIFLKYAYNRFLPVHEELKSISEYTRRTIGPDDYKAKSVLFLPNEARYPFLLNLPEEEVVGNHINNAMSLIEKHNPDLKGILPKDYNQFRDTLMSDVLRIFNKIPTDIDQDYFGRIYEYFLNKFKIREGKDGEDYTPDSIVKLIVNIIEPFEGKIYDPACGSGGMFVQSSNFINQHQENSTEKISIYGQEKEKTTVKLAKMNLAVHGLTGDIKQGNTFYEDNHNSFEKFDYVMANPPFNVDKVKKDRLTEDKRYSFGIPSADNANYLWIQDFYNSLNSKGKAGFVMANSASDASGSELELRKKIIKTGCVDVMITLSTNFFYVRTIPVMLWFFDKGKPEERKDKILFIDARKIYNQIDKTHRNFKPEQLEFLSNIVRLYRGNEIENKLGSQDLLTEHFSDGYNDVEELCKVVELSEIEAQGWTLNPARYVGLADEEDDGVDFYKRLSELNDELNILNAESGELERLILTNNKKIISND